MKGSILDYPLLKNLFNKYKFKYVFHCAAYAAEGLSHFIKRFNYENNLIGSVNLINQSVIHKVKCFVFTSSIAVYGAVKPPMVEDMTPAPEDPYGIAKHAVEDELRVTNEMFGLPYIIFRPHNVYGERQNLNDKYRNVIGIFMNQIMRHQPMTIFGDGSQKRAFSYIDDVAPVIAQSIKIPEAYNQVFNIGSDKAYSVNRIAKEVARAFGVVPKIKYVPKRNEVLEAYSDHEKVRSVFRLSGKEVPIEIGLSYMAHWAFKQKLKKQKKFKNIEITENLPESWK